MKTNNRGFSLIELVVSIAIILMLSISIGRFANSTVKIVKDVDDSLFIEDSVNYSYEFIREYIEVMGKISHIEGEMVEMENGEIGYDFKSISFMNENYFRDEIAHFSIVRKTRIAQNDEILNALVFRRSDLEGHRDISPKGGGEIIDFLIHDMIAIPLPHGTHYLEAGGIKFVFSWEGRTGIYDFEKSFYFKNKN